MRPAVLALLLLAFLPGTARAASVAYIDGNAVWVASTDGTQRHQLAGDPGDGRRWTELAQSDGGRVLAVRREPGKISQINAFTLWGPDGAIVHQWSLIHQPGWSTYAYPVTLDLTADGRNAVYGYSNTRGFYPTMEFETGSYVMYADRPPASEPFRIPGQASPSVAGARLVTVDGSIVNVQRASGQPPFSTEFDPWIDVSGTGLELARADVAANGTVAAAEVVEWSGSTRVQGKIAMLPIAGLGGTLGPGDCFLPGQGVATHVSISQDGTLVAWKDDRGIVVAGIPDFSGAEPCALTRPPVVISATGTWPSLGAATVPSPAAPPPVPPAGGGAPGGGGGTPGASAAPRVTLAKRVRASALRRGLALKVGVAAAGPVTAVGRVRGAVVARGRGRATRAGTVTIRLRATRKARKRLGRLRGKTLVLRVTAGGATATLRRTLR